MSTFLSFIIGALMALGAIVAGSGGHSGDEYRYCYSIVPGQTLPSPNIGTATQPWSCYLKADRPTGLEPVWEGWRSDIPTNTATIGGTP